METQLLRDQDVYPSEAVLKIVLKDSFTVYMELMEIITGVDYGLIANWNYYKDGKAWLCKVCHKKKTIFWLSAWEGCFKTGFYFTEKNCSGIPGLNIDESIKKDFSNRQPVGKLLPLVVIVNREEQIRDLLKIIEYKKKLK